MLASTQTDIQKISQEYRKGNTLVCDCTCIYYGNNFGSYFKIKCMCRDKYRNSTKRYSIYRYYISIGMLLFVYIEHAFVAIGNFKIKVVSKLFFCSWAMKIRSSYLIVLQKHVRYFSIRIILLRRDNTNAIPTQCWTIQGILWMVNVWIKITNQPMKINFFDHSTLNGAKLRWPLVLQAMLVTNA